MFRNRGHDAPLVGHGMTLTWSGDSGEGEGWDRELACGVHVVSVIFFRCRQNHTAESHDDDAGPPRRVTLLGQVSCERPLELLARNSASS